MFAREEKSMNLLIGLALIMQLWGQHDGVGHFPIERCSLHSSIARST